MNTAPSTVKKISIHVYCANLRNKFTTNETVERKKHYNPITPSPIQMVRPLSSPTKFAVEADSNNLLFTQ